MPVFAKILFSVLIYGVLSFAPALISAQIRATMEDLMNEPERFYGMEVRIIGTAILSSEQGYILQNDIGRVMEIVSRDQPEVEKKYEVLVKVVQKPDSPEPMLMEIKRKRYTGGNSWIVIFAVLMLSGMLAAGGGGAP